jgi:subtilisin family serine protease
MFRHRALLMFLAASLATVLHAQPINQEPRLAPVINRESPTAIPDQYFVILQPNASRQELAAVESAIRQLGGEILHRYIATLKGFAVHIDDSALQSLRAIPGVTYIEADQSGGIAIIQNNPPAGLDRTSERLLALDNRYTYSETGLGVHVYVLDTGILNTHTEFGGRSSDASDQADGSLPADDCNGHGTHVAGTIGGATYGIAKQVTLHNVRVIPNCNGTGPASTAAAGVDWVRLNHIGPARAIINMSLQYGAAVTLDTAVANAVAANITVVAAAGNANTDACTISPGRAPAAITVGNANPTNDTRASDSNWGTCLDLFGPGVNILSAWRGSNTDFNTISGTSMAAPHVTGVAARYLQGHAGATPAQIWAAILNAANVATTPTWGSGPGVISRGAGSPNVLLHWGSLNDGFNDGDPHITTVDGTRYDFQTAGEFVALRDAGMEIQTRQTAIPTTFFPGANPHTGLATCVSVNTAVAARVGSHRITYQPNLSGVPDPSGLQLRVNGVLTTIGPQGLALSGGGRIANTAAGGGIEVRFPDDTVLYVTPGWWADQGKWYLNFHVARTPATMGIMGAIPAGSWLPALPSGTSVGPMPASLSQRYIDLNQTFANAWRVTPATSLFDYAPGTSTATFTLSSWPPSAPPCTLPGVGPANPATLAVAEEACASVEGDLKADCVFDVRVTGETGFATTYLATQRLRNGATTTMLQDLRDPTTLAGSPAFSVTVAPMKAGGGTPAGVVRLFIDGTETGNPIPLDTSGRASWPTVFALPGTHVLSAAYTPDPGSAFLESRSDTTSTLFVSAPTEPTLFRRGRWWWGGAVGSAHPLTGFNKIADANIYAKLDASRDLNASLALRLALGFAQFTAQPALTIDHPHYTHLSANVQWLTPYGASSRLYLNGGPGWYRDENNATSLGGNIGAGVQIDSSSSNRIELGADYHLVSEGRARFLTWHLGILFRR